MDKEEAMKAFVEAGQCPNCGTHATYKIAENSFGCKCTYEFETGADLIKEEMD